MKQWMKKKAGWGALACVLILSACGGGGSGAANADIPAANAPGSGGAVSGGQPAGSDKQAQTERVFTDDYGKEVKIEGTPKRVLAVYLEDPLVALGVKPLLQFAFNGDQGATYLQSHIRDVPLAGNPPMPTPERALELAPDLIITHSLILAPDKVDTYRKIAPTYALDASKSNWKQILLKVGELLNESEKAKQVLNDYETQIAKAKETLAGTVKQETFALLRVVNKEIRLYRVNDPFSGELLYQDLGLTPHPLVRELPENGNISLSLEKIADLDADHILLVINDTGKAFAEELQKSAIWKQLPSVQRGQVYEVDPTMWLSLGYMANTGKMNDLLQRVSKAK